MKPMKALQSTTSLFLAVIILLSSWGIARAQSAELRYFPETGHNLSGAFLQFYQAAKNPKLVYGYPITEQIVSRDGKTVQYFQRARFELTPSQRVQLTPLGTLIYQPKSPLPIQSATGCETYPTGHRVCFTFLDFYKANGGPGQFGNPISPFESSEGLIVQYFEGARFEWRADRPAENWVVISDLGRIYFDRQGEDPAHLKPVPPLDATINPVLSLRVRAFVLDAVTLKSGRQTVYVIVQSQTSQVVSGAAVNVICRLPDGIALEQQMITNASGIAEISFNFNDQKVGELVPIDIYVNYQNITGATRTSFRIWF